MGIVTEEGQQFKEKCPSCGELVQIKATGVDIVCCPYCCNTLMEHQADEKILSLSMSQVSELILKYRNANDPQKKEDYLADLKNKLYWLNADIEFLKQNS